MPIEMRLRVPLYVLSKNKENLCLVFKLGKRNGFSATKSAAEALAPFEQGIFLLVPYLLLLAWKMKFALIEAEVKINLVYVIHIRHVNIPEYD